MKFGFGGAFLEKNGVRRTDSGRSYGRRIIGILLSSSIEPGEIKTPYQNYPSFAYTVKHLGYRIAADLRL